MRLQSIRVVTKTTFQPSPPPPPTTTTTTVYGNALYYFYAQTTQNDINIISQLDRIGDTGNQTLSITKAIQVITKPIVPTTTSTISSLRSFPTVSKNLASGTRYQSIKNVKLQVSYKRVTQYLDQLKSIDTQRGTIAYSVLSWKNTIYYHVSIVGVGHR